MDYDGMTLLELKKLCKSRGLKVSGTKDEVIIRLMENDETSNIPKNAVTSNVANPQAFVTINTVQENGMMKFIGTLVVLYGFFRIGWSIIFSFSQFGVWILSPIGLLIGMAFVFGGFLIYGEYRNGIYFTLVTLTISGILSLLFHADDWSSLTPVSAPMVGDSMIMTSSMCSLSCLGIVAIPLLLSALELKQGWPPAMEPLMENLRGLTNNKRSISCGKCDTSLLVPKEYHGKIKCPSCDSEMTV
jgi:hypothetical protein